MTRERVFSLAKQLWQTNRLLIVLSATAIVIKLFSLFPNAVELCYSRGLYRITAALQRILLGWIPISVGDILYTAAAALALYKLYRLVRRAVKKELSWAIVLKGLRWLATAALSVYISFYILWGLNYNRRSLAHAMGLRTERYDIAELAALTQTLADRLHALDASPRLDRESLASRSDLFTGAVRAYESLSREPYGLSYSFRSLKPTMFGPACTYLGFPGYFNPFSGEAHVNMSMPAFDHPFVLCHEMSHQLGHASEQEAHFAGYLAAKSSADPLFQYSAYLWMYSYAHADLRRQSPEAAARIDRQIPAGVQQDWKKQNAFWSQFRSPKFKPVRRIRTRILDQYLRMNQQPSGAASYNEVVGLLIAYSKKYGNEAL